jgi:hypothetical protein
MKKYQILNLLVDGKKYHVENISGKDMLNIIKNGLYYCIKKHNIKTDFSTNLKINLKNNRDGWLYVEDMPEVVEPTEVKNELETPKQMEMTFEEYFWNNYGKR